MTRVLLADDHPIILSGIEAVLRGSDYEIVATAPDGNAALAAIAKNEAEIFLLDVRMPRRSGLDVLRHLRGRGDKRPIILLTASLEDADLVEAIQLGVDGIVLKESAQELLLHALDRVKTGRRWIDPSLMEKALDAAQTPGGTRSPGSGLTARERALVRLVAQGRRNREIADELGITEGTIKVYLHRLYQRLGVSNRTELAMRAREISSL